MKQSHLIKKAERVIRSCYTQKQLDVAYEYLRLVAWRVGKSEPKAYLPTRKYLERIVIDRGFVINQYLSRSTGRNMSKIIRVCDDSGMEEFFFTEDGVWEFLIDEAKDQDSPSQDEIDSCEVGPPLLDQILDARKTGDLVYSARTLFDYFVDFIEVNP